MPFRMAKYNYNRKEKNIGPFRGISLDNLAYDVDIITIRRGCRRQPRCFVIYRNFHNIRSFVLSGLRQAVREKSDHG